MKKTLKDCPVHGHGANGLGCYCEEDINQGGEMKEVLCDRCGKNMYDEETGITTIGICISRNGEKSELLDHSWGKYTKDRYDFCYECWLDSLMGTQVKEKIQCVMTQFDPQEDIYTEKDGEEL